MALKTSSPGGNLLFRMMVNHYSKSTIDRMALLLDSMLGSREEWLGTAHRFLDYITETGSTEEGFVNLLEEYGA